MPRPSSENSVWRCVSPRRIWSSLPSTRVRQPRTRATSAGSSSWPGARSGKGGGSGCAGQEPRLRVGLEAAGVDVLLDRLLRERELDREGRPVVARPGQPQPAVLRPARRSTLHREASGRVRNASRLAPPALGHGGDVGLPVLDARARASSARTTRCTRPPLVDRELRRRERRASRVLPLSRLRSSSRRRSRRASDLRLRRQPSVPSPPRTRTCDRALVVEHRSGLALLSISLPLSLPQPSSPISYATHTRSSRVDRDRRPRLEEVAGARR